MTARQFLALALVALPLAACGTPEEGQRVLAGFNAGLDRGFERARIRREVVEDIRFINRQLERDNGRRRK